MKSSLGFSVKAICVCLFIFSSVLFFSGVNITYALVPQDITVTTLQSFLEQRGFLVILAGQTKGDFGPLTKQALVAYQKSVGLPAEGDFGQQTKAKIAEVLTSSQTLPIVDVSQNTQPLIPYARRSLTLNSSSQNASVINTTGAVSSQPSNIFTPLVSKVQALIPKLTKSTPAPVTALTPLTPISQTITRSELDSRLQNLTNSLNSKIASIPTVGGGGGSVDLSGVYQMIAQSQKIDSLTNTTLAAPTINNSVITGGSISGVTISGTTIGVNTLTISTTTAGCLNTDSSGIVYSTACSAGAGMSIGGTVTSGTPGSVLFVGSSGLAQDNANFFWKQTGGLLGLGTTTPTYGLTVASTTGPQLALSAGAGLSQFTLANEGGNFYLGTTTVAGNATTSISALEISGSGFGTTTLRGLNISGQATSTSNVGLTISSGCYAIGTTCIGTYGDTNVNSFVNSSTTIPKTYTANTFTTLQTFNYSSSTIYSSFNTASTTNLIVNGSSFNNLAGSGLTNTSGALSLNTANPNTWSALQSFNYSTSTLYSSFKTASTTNLIINNSSFNNLLGTGLKLSSGALTFDTSIANVFTAIQKFNANASSTAFSANFAEFGGTATTTFTNVGTVGISTTTPVATLSIAGQNISETGRVGTQGTDRGLYISPQQSSSPLIQAVDFRAFEIAPYTLTLASTSLSNSYGSLLNAYTVGTSTVGTILATASTMAITGAPIASTSNMTISSSTGLSIFPGSVVTGSGVVTNAYGLVVQAPTGAQNNYAASFTGGNVGVGTSSPFALLSINPNGIGNAPAFVIGSTTSTGFLVTNMGRVGIGTTSPVQAFSLVGDMFLDTSNIFIGTSTTGTATTTIFALATTSLIISNNNASSFSIGTSTKLIGGNGGTGAIFNIASVGATTTIGFFTSTTTGLYSGNGVALSQQNLIIFGDGTGTTSLAVVKGSLCLDMDGWCTAASSTAGLLSARRTNISNSDLAEMYNSTEPLVPGDIVSPTFPVNNVKKAITSDQMLGVVSTDPGITLGSGPDYAGGGYPIALAGRVPIKVNNEGGNIEVGDHITLSSVSGVGKKASLGDQSIAVALDSFDFTNISSGSVLGFISKSDENVASISTPWDVSFSGTSQALRDGLSALGSTIVHAYNGIVYAGAGVFDKIFAKEVNTDKLCVGNVCVNQQQFLAMVQAVGGSSNQSLDTSLPVVTITGSNPSEITIGSTYSDMGATVTDTNADGSTNSNLGLHFSVDGVNMDSISIDTSTTTLHTIVYSAVDSSGNWGYATRTVEILGQ